MATLVIQHVLPKFERTRERCNFDPEEYLASILEWIARCIPERIIVTKEHHLDEMYPELERDDFEIEEWSWTHDDIENDDAIAENLGIPVGDLVRTHSGGHEFLSVLQPWMRSLVNDSVVLMGGFEGECLKGLEDGLDRLDVNFKKHQDRLYPREC